MPSLVIRKGSGHRTEAILAAVLSRSRGRRVVGVIENTLLLLGRYQ